MYAMTRAGFIRLVFGHAGEGTLPASECTPHALWAYGYGGSKYAAVKEGLLQELLAGKTPEGLAVTQPQPQPVEAQPETVEAQPVEAQPETTPGNTVEVKSLVQFKLPAIFTDDRIPLTVITDQHGDPWWVASEVCAVLGYSNPGMPFPSTSGNTRKIPSRFAREFQVPENPNKTIINEGGLNGLILRSRTPQAGKFQDWVTDEVLPQIRKTGSCNVDPETNTDQTLLALAKGVIELTDWKQKAQPKVAYYDTYATCEGLFSLTEAAKHLGLNPHHFLAKLRYDKVLYKTGTASINRAFQQYIDDGCFVLNAPTTGRGYAWPQTLVTPKGLLFLIARYGRFGNRAAVMHPDKTPTMSA